MPKERFTYVIAFRGDGFIMVKHRERAWEMPGGRLKPGENFEQAAIREFFEETGMSLEVIGHIREPRPWGRVFVGIAREALTEKPSEYNIEEVKEFDELPVVLSFPLVEYNLMLAQARRILAKYKKRKGIGGSASPPINGNRSQ